MTNPTDIRHQQSLLEAHRATLAYLLNQRAKQGANHAPPGVYHGIIEARTEIHRIKAYLRGHSVFVADHANDEAAPDEPQPARVPVCARPQASTLWGRDAIRDEIVARLCGAAETVAISAVRGLPGVGKTDLVRTVGCDARTTAHFTGGVLYAELGPHANASSLLRRWLVELGVEPPQSDDPGTLSAVLRRELAVRCVLLILDDVWETSVSAAMTLRDCAGPGCRVLVSSRSREVARTLGDKTPTTLEVLTDPAALDLLREYAPQVVNADEVGAKQLAAALGRLPLALKLAGALLYNDRHSQKPCAALLHTWRAKLDALRGHEPRPGTEDTQLSLGAIIGLSYDALPDDATRAAASALAAFGSTPLDWDWDAMAAVWCSDEEQTGAWERALVASGLLEWDDASRRYSLHQVVHAFLEQRVEQDTYERHAAYYAALMLRCDKDIQHESTIDPALAMLDREIGQIERGQVVTMQAESSPDHDKQIIRYAFGCATYFDLRGRYEQKISWSNVGYAAAQRQHRERDVAAMLGNLGTVYQRQGRYDEAIDYYKRSLAITEQIDDMATSANQLGNLGNVYQSQGRYDEAIDYYQRGLIITERISDQSGEARMLSNLGILCKNRGHYDEAIGYYQRSLAIKEQIGDQLGIALTLGNLGIVYSIQGHYDEAIDYCQRSLAITERIGDETTSANQYGNLGTIYRNQGRHNEAIDNYQRSLAIQERIGDVVGTAITCWNLGALYGMQDNLAKALPLLERAAEIAKRIGMPDAEMMRATVEEMSARLAAEGAA